MKTNQAFAALGGVLVVYGLLAFQFAWPPFTPVLPTCVQHQSQYCHGSNCDIDVTVASCSAAGITLSVPELHLCKSGGAKTINWKLQPGGAYKFRDAGVDFKSLPDTQDFDPATKRKGPFKYSWDNKLRNGGGRQFDYWIRLEDSSGHLCDKDPRIVND